VVVLLVVWCLGFGILVDLWFVDLLVVVCCDTVFRIVGLLWVVGGLDSLQVWF